jgi:hypothetical protein
MSGNRSVRDFRLVGMAHGWHPQDRIKRVVLSLLMSISVASRPLAWSYRPILSLLILVVVACFGCYSPGRSRILTEAAPLDESSRSTFGRIGLLVPESSPAFVFEHPLTRNSAAAIENSAEKTWDFAEWDDGLGEMAARIIISGVGGVIGGALTGVPQRDIDAAEKDLRVVLRQSPVLPGISNRVQSFVEAQGNSALAVIPAELAACLNDAEPNDRDYSPLVPLGIDSVMEIVVEWHGFRAREGSNPLMALEAIVQVHITRVSDGALLFSGPIRYQGHQHRFTHWAQDNARNFRSELRRVGRMVGRSVVDEILAPGGGGSQLSSK